MRIFILALGLLTAAEPGAARSAVLELTDADFDYMAAELETLLVKFYAPWCGHCKKLAPEFETAATKLKGTVSLAKVDCTSNAQTCGRFGVTGYPTLKIFRSGEESSSYDGPRSSDGIVNYMRKNAGPNSYLLKTQENIDSFASNSDASVVGFFAGTDSSGLSEFLRAAALMRDQYRFGHVTELELGLKYGVDAEAVLLFRPPRLRSKFEEDVVRFGEPVTTPALRRFIRDNIFGLCPHLTKENKDKLKGRDLLTAYYDLDYTRNPKGSNYWRNRVMKAGSQFASRGLTFAVANQRDFQDELEEDFGLGTSDGGELPFVTIRTRLGQKYTMREEFTRDGKSLERFLTDFFAGQLKPYVKSEAIPATNKGPVKVVVADTFEEIVNDPEKDVLIEFYAPWCGHCKKLEPKYTAVAEQLSGDPNIVVAKMDAVANDVPQGYDVQGFPTIYFAPAGKKKEPKHFVGGREVKDFIDFLKREATRPLVLSGVREEL
ncbi:protein disulfide-isomerase A3-like isoform X2 [Denticeps clupeoides]|uniref:Protein disulfide-isomerase n=1 Tax=Denticeps clupeoides TaxID=299321 RepID=A0AAY4CCE1_9TELE|nr:protein disulfide-isomerase A3-like isoform X2 [Denticeps clupeoides]